MFPRTANKIIKAQLEARGGELAGEEYTLLGATEYSTVISKIAADNSSNLPLHVRSYAVPDYCCWTSPPKGFSH